MYYTNHRLINIVCLRYYALSWTQKVFTLLIFFAGGGSDIADISIALAHALIALVLLNSTKKMRQLY